MRIQDNISAMNINRFLGINKKMICKNTEKLSSGYRINRAGDDAAGLSISEKMRNQIRGLNQAVKNIEDGISLIQTAEEALNETHSILARMRELAVQVANDIYDTEDRMAIQAEVDELVKEVDDIANKTHFNEGIYPLLGADPRSIMLGYLTQKTYTFTAQNEIIVDDKTYHPGDSVAVTAVRIDYEMNGEKFYYGAMFGSSKSGNGSGLHNWDDKQLYPNGPSESDERKAVINVYDRRDGISRSVTIDDFGVDENGDIYYRHWSWDPGKNCFKSDNSYMNAYYNPSTIPPKVVGAGHKGSPYNMKVRTGDKPTFLWIQSGANTGEGINLSLVNATAAAIGIKHISVMSNAEAGNAIQTVDGAVKKVSEYRSAFGAQQNRLERTMAANMYYSENLREAESKLRDTDMAEEIAAYFKQNVLIQAGQAILAQTNKSPQAVLSLL